MERFFKAMPSVVVAYQSMVSPDPGVANKVTVPAPHLEPSVPEGIAGAVFGDAVAEPAALVHPFIIWVTVYLPEVFTVMDEVVSLVLHNKLPVAFVDKVEDPLQLFITVIVGVAGAVFGDAVAEPASLVHPFMV